MIEIKKLPIEYKTMDYSLNHPREINCDIFIITNTNINPLNIGDIFIDIKERTTNTIIEDTCVTNLDYVVRQRYRYNSKELDKTLREKILPYYRELSII